jgi:hypothetical protein
VDEGCQTTPLRTPRTDTSDDDVQIVHESTPRKQQFKPSSDYYIIKGIDDPCSNLYEFNFRFPPPFEHADPDVASDFCSAEQAFQYHRVRPHNDGVAQEISSEPNPYKAIKLAKKCPARRSEENDVELMRKIVQAKVSQCRAFRDAMRSANAMGLQFIHSTYPADKVFASGLRYDEKHIPTVLPGKNILGHIVADCARNLKQETSYEISDTRAEFVNGIAIILNDGERLPLSMRRTPFPHNATTRSRREKLLGRPLAPWERNPPPKARPTRNGPQSSQPGGPAPICFHCGVPGHLVKNCRLKHVAVICRLCGESGHKQRYCISGKRKGAAPAQKREPLLRPTDFNDGNTYQTIPAHSQNAPPNLPAFDYVCIPSVAQNADPVRHVSQPMYVPGFHPGTYGLSYHQNFPPLTNSTPQNF